MHIYKNTFEVTCISISFINPHLPSPITGTLAQWFRALAQQAEGWIFESQPRQTKVVKTGSDSSTAKRSEIGVSFTGPRR